MDASLESFLKYRVDRIRDISLQVGGDRKDNLIPKFCEMISNFCLNRPKSPFFDKAEGTKIIRKDLKYFFPAIFGFDIRPFTSGAELDFDQDLFTDKKEALIGENPLLKAVARLNLLTMCYDLLTVDIEDLLEIDDQLVEKAREKNDTFLKLFGEYLIHVLEVPPHAKALRLVRGNIQQAEQMESTRENHETVIRWIEAGIIPLDIEKLETIFEKLCLGKTSFPSKGSFAIDSGNRVVIDTMKLAQRPVSDEELVRALRDRYHLTSYLFTACYFKRSKEKKDQLRQKVVNSLKNLPDLSSESIDELAEFFIGERSQSFHDKIGFYFDPLPKSALIDWRKWERESVFLGDKPRDPKLSPQRTQLPEPLVVSPKRPVCILLDVSASMVDCLDIAMKSLMSLFAKLKHHPINIALFSSYAGVLNKGVPIISRGLPVGQEISWLPRIVDNVRKGLFLGGSTSMGNGIMLGKAIALGTASKMNQYDQWIAENQIAAHCVLISDNLHNTPRDIAETDMTGNYVMESDENVVAHCARSGCSVHNIICCSPTSRVDRLIYKMQAMRCLELIMKQFFFQDTPGMIKAKAIEKDLFMTVVSNKPKTMLFKYRDQDRFTLVNRWIESKRLDQLTHAIASFVVYIRAILREDSDVYDTVEFVGRQYGITPEDFLADIVNMDTVFELYQIALGESEVTLQKLDNSIFDANPTRIFDISHCISATQHRFFKYSTTPVIIKMDKPMDRRKDFDDDLYFGLKNLAALDGNVGHIADQIESMNPASDQ